MSAFANGSDFGSSDSGTSLSGALASGNDLTKGVSGDQSGLTSALDSSAIPNVGADTYQFKLPAGMASDVASNASGPSTAGLTGVGSGMTMPNFSAAMGGSGGYDSNNVNWGGLQAAGSKLQGALKQDPVKSGGSGRVSMKSENFGAPVIALPMASGSAAGNSLLQMMQKYQPGNLSGTNTGTGYGMR